MLEYKLDSRNVSRWILLVINILILLGSVGITEASVYYSLTNESQATVRSPEVILQNGTVGTSTIYTSQTSAKVVVEAPSVYDFVDNNTSNVDSNASIGTHFNFTAQQYGPDSVFDNLTETGNVSGVVNNSENFVDDNTSNIDGVDDKGTHGNFTAQQYADSVYDTLTEGNTGGSITFRNSSGWSGQSSLTIPKPSGTVQNDVMVANIYVVGTNPTINTPSGWALILSTVDGTTARLSCARAPCFPYW